MRHARGSPAPEPFHDRTCDPPRLHDAEGHDNIARARRLLDIRAEQPEAGDDSCAEVIEPKPLSQPCPCCGGRMIIIETFQRGASPRTRPSASTAVIRIDTS